MQMKHFSRQLEKRAGLRHWIISHTFMQNITRPLSPHPHPSPPALLQISRSHSGNNESHVRSERARAVKVHAVIAAGKKRTRSWNLKILTPCKKTRSAGLCLIKGRNIWRRNESQISRGIAYLFVLSSTTRKARRFTSSPRLRQKIAEIARHLNGKFLWCFLSKRMQKRQLK